MDRNPAPPNARRRSWLTVLGLALCGPALFFLALAISVTWRELVAGGTQQRVFSLLFLAIGSLPLGLSLGLAEWGDPGVLGRLAGGLVRGLRSALSPSGLRDLARHPPGLALLTAVVAAGAMWLVPASAALLVVLLALCAFAVADPLLNVWRHSWWAGALLSAPSYAALFLGLSMLADARNELGEDSMVLLFPMMLYPVTLGASGLLRLALRLRAGDRKAPGAPADPDASGSARTP